MKHAQGSKTAAFICCLVLSIVAACGGDDHGETNTGECERDDECPSAAPVCSSNTCVECTPESDALCAGTTPVCGSEGTCRGCTSHSDCNSNLCLADGACANEDAIAYVNASGSGTSCTKSSPCSLLQDALATTRPLIRVTSVERSADTVTISSSVAIHADPGTTLDRDGDGPILQLDGTADVTITDLKIAGATGLGTNASIGVGAGAKLSLIRATVTENDGRAINAEGTLLVENSNISGNAGVAIVATSSARLTILRTSISGNQSAIASAGGTLEVSESTILANSRAGIGMSAPAVVSITNSIIARNGYVSPSSFSGGASLQPLAGSKFEFNTLADNVGVDVGAVSCNGTFTMGNNLIYRNSSMSGTYGQTQGTCNFGNSLVVTDTTVGNALAFVSPNVQPYDYHLTELTPATVVDAAGTCSGVDVDGDDRPIGTACDLGADELAP